MRAVIIIKSSGYASDRIKLRRDVTIIGRDKADVVLNDPEISATHCQIQKVNDEYFLFDMNSTNGTFVNGERVVKIKLQNGDSIRIGGSLLQVELVSEEAAQRIPTVFRPPNDHQKTKTQGLIETLIEEEIQIAGGVSGIVLAISYRDGTAERVEIRQKLLYIGRSTTFGKFDQDIELSRRHVMIKLNRGGELFVEDQGSTNGTYVNGLKIKGLVQVMPKDEIRIGDTFLKIAPLQS